MEAKQPPIAGARASERIADARVAHIKVFLDREHASRLTLRWLHTAALADANR